MLEWLRAFSNLTADQPQQRPGEGGGGGREKTGKLKSPRERV